MTLSFSTTFRRTLFLSDGDGTEVERRTLRYQKPPPSVIHRSPFTVLISYAKHNMRAHLIIVSLMYVQQCTDIAMQHSIRYFFVLIVTALIFEH